MASAIRNKKITKNYSKKTGRQEVSRPKKS
jgi:hypothetical protein